MNVAIDAMGGDYAPLEIIKGACEAIIKDPEINITFVGDEHQIRDILNRQLPQQHLKKAHQLEILHTPDKIEMHEPATAALRKTGASLSLTIELLKDGSADAVVTAGNTAAAMMLASIKIGKFIERPAIATRLPNLESETVLLDVGASVDCKPIQLLQFAIMGSTFASIVLNKKQPRVGLLSIGEEPSKGNSLTKQAFELLSGHTADINFIGNVEGRDLFSGAVDVVVCDGFVGNVALKVGEGYAEFIANILQDYVKVYKLEPQEFLEGLKSKMDYAEYGGAPLLGIGGVVIISHGRSTAKAIANAIAMAKRCYESKVVEAIASKF